MFKRIFTLSVFALLLCFNIQAKESGKSVQAVKDLVVRIMPGHASRFIFEINPSAKERYFEIRQSRRKIRIEGDSPTSVAAGLNYYLKKIAGTSLSWSDFQMNLPAILPLPKESIHKNSPYKIVTYLNYCTFGYTTAYWDWERWEKEIDLMALNGVTHPLAMVGVEEVWRRFLVRIGYADSEAKAFLPGPSYMPWLLMGNMEGLGGPMPDEWFERQVQLQRRIVARMREYGMEPIFQAFFGMVPTTFKKKFPDAFVVPQGDWNGYTRPGVLSPLDTLFRRFAKIWYDEYHKLFGKANYYAGDLFHEGGKTGGLDVARCARAVEANLLIYNPKAVWVVQSWGANPTKELMNGLSPEHVVVIELCAEFWHRWKGDGSYNSLPWVWSNISNWGGNIGLHGRLDAIATRPVEAQKDPKAGKTLKGIGFTPEGIETNPVVMYLWSDMVWSDQAPDMNAWIEAYPQYRYGSSLPSLRTAWKGFYNTVYGTYSTHRRPSEPVFCAKPSLNVTTVSAWSQSKIFYNPKEFAEACALFLRDASVMKDNVNYQYDAIDVVRQYISDLGRTTYTALVQAWKERDRSAFEHETKRYLQLIADQDELLLSHPAFCLQSWLQEAQDAGKTRANGEQYAFYNRLILTSWNNKEGPLDDYAHREWGGLLGTYYYERWNLYFNYLYQAWDNPVLPEPRLFDVTEMWWYKNIDRQIRPSGQDPVETAVRMFGKYYN